MRRSPPPPPPPRAKKGAPDDARCGACAGSRRLLGPDSLADFEAIETALRRRVMAVAARLLARRLNSDVSDHSAPTLACSCGGQARYAGRKDKRFHTVLGEILLSRAYYHCRDCGHGFCPRDRALGMSDASLSPALVRMVGAVGATVSFQDGSSLLRELGGVEVDPKRVEREAERLGAEIAEDEKSFILPANSTPPPDPLHGPRRHWHPHAPPRARRASGQAAGRLGQDPRGQGVRRLDRREQRPQRASRP